MKLYYHPGSGNCRRVLAVAAHLELPLELLAIDFMDPNDANSKKMKSLDPSDRIPLFEEAGFVLPESNAIMQYLTSKKVGQTLYPEDAKSRAEVLRWQCFTLAHLEEATGPLVYENLFKKVFGMCAADAAEVEEALEGFMDHAEVLDAHLKGKKFFVGNTLSIADFCVGAALMYWEPAGIPLTKFKNLHAWYQNLESLPAWKKTTPKF